MSLLSLLLRCCCCYYIMWLLLLLYLPSHHHHHRLYEGLWLGFPPDPRSIPKNLCPSSYVLDTAKLLPGPFPSKLQLVVFIPSPGNHTQHTLISRITLSWTYSASHLSHFDLCSQNQHRVVCEPRAPRGMCVKVTGLRALTKLRRIFLFFQSSHIQPDKESESYQ